MAVADLEGVEEARRAAARPALLVLAPARNTVQEDQADPAGHLAADRRRITAAESAAACQTTTRKNATAAPKKAPARVR